jgi:hypothetical protein
MNEEMKKRLIDECRAKAGENVAEFAEKLLSLNDEDINLMITITGLKTILPLSKVEMLMLITTFRVLKEESGVAFDMMCHILNDAIARRIQDGFKEKENHAEGDRGGEEPKEEN